VLHPYRWTEEFFPAFLADVSGRCDLDGNLRNVVFGDGDTLAMLPAKFWRPSVDVEAVVNIVLQNVIAAVEILDALVGESLPNATFFANGDCTIKRWVLAPPPLFPHTLCPT